MSRCGGGSAANGGDYARATDPWLAIGADGTVFAMGLAFTGTAGAGGANAMLVSRSFDGGLSWSAPAALITDAAGFFNDKNTITADPTDARFVYAVWDRLVPGGGGPAYLASSLDGGASWQPATSIFDPGPASQTLGNRIVVLADGPERGTLLDFFTQLDTAGGTVRMHLDVIRSIDQGQTWSAPVRVADMLGVGVRDSATGALVRDAVDLASVAAGPGGLLWATWQDARFSNGQRDAIALSRSNDGGRTWSAPLAINTVASAAAFEPIIEVRADGTLGVLHYDLRSDTSSTASLLAEAWLLSSRDGVQWTEAKVFGPFDLAAAPRGEGGYFLGDYQGLASGAGRFVPVLALSRPGAANNRTDIFALPVDVSASAAAAHAARAAPPVQDVQRAESALRASQRSASRTHRVAPSGISSSLKS